MNLQARIFVFVIGLVVFLFVINLVRTRKLKEEFALLWLMASLFLVVAPLAIDFLNQVAYAVGVDYPPAFLFLITIILFLFIFFQFSLNISKFSDQIKVLAQELAILSYRLERLENTLSSQNYPGGQNGLGDQGQDGDLSAGGDAGFAPLE